MPGFLIGIVVGAVAASAYLKKKGGASLSAPSAGTGSYRDRSVPAGGRVDEFSSAAQATNPESARLNAGDGTPAGTSGTSGTSSFPATGLQNPATGLSESRH
jgi:hypothetical protein